MVGSPPHLRSLPTLNFLESLSRTLLVTSGEKEPQTLSSICVSSLSRPSRVKPQRELGHVPGLRGHRMA